MCCKFYALFQYQGFGVETWHLTGCPWLPCLPTFGACLHGEWHFASASLEALALGRASPGNKNCWSKKGVRLRDENCKKDRQKKRERENVSLYHHLFTTTVDATNHQPITGLNHSTDELVVWCLIHTSWLGSQDGSHFGNPNVSADSTVESKCLAYHMYNVHCVCVCNVCALIICIVWYNAGKNVLTIYILYKHHDLHRTFPASRQVRQLALLDTAAKRPCGRPPGRACRAAQQFPAFGSSATSDAHFSRDIAPVHANRIDLKKTKNEERIKKDNDQCVLR